MTDQYNSTFHIKGPYQAREVITEDLFTSFEQLKGSITLEAYALDIEGLLSLHERKQRDRLRDRGRQLFRLNLLIYCEEQLVGWSFGKQKGVDTFLMINSALLPEHQGNGVYSALLPLMLTLLKNEGFQEVRSNHRATNNRVLIPKLRAGFVITGTHLNDMFGFMVQLTYYFNKKRREAFAFREGSRPPHDLLPYLGPNF